MKTLSIEAFERCDVDPEHFDHEAHIAIAWRYLERYEPELARQRFVAALRALTVHLGAPDKYHETITRFYLDLIDERRQSTGGSSIDEFLERNPDLKDPRLIVRHYSEERIRSPVARTEYLAPDRAA